jgi:hypothetical protein
MTLRFHSMILTTAVAATLAVGFASAAVITDHSQAAPKGDRLPVATTTADAGDYVTVETRGDGVSILERVPVN